MFFLIIPKISIFFVNTNDLQSGLLEWAQSWTRNPFVKKTPQGGDLSFS